MSSDICAIKLGQKVGAEGLLSMLQNFGFGPNGTATLFPGGRAGKLPPSEEDPEHPRLIPYISEGAGFEVTPIEMVQAYGAIINGGNLMAPLPADAPDSRAQVLRRVLTPESTQKMRAILRQVILNGTATHGRSSLYTTAGKTATSHYPRVFPFDPLPDYASFIGFAPMDKPRVEVYVGIREPESSDGAHGNTHATPVFKEIIEQVLQYMKVPPDQPQG